jgi:trans-2,3-dihydro-3-hydroxyanthranilate isomerase
VPISLTWRGDQLSFVWMTQLNPTFGPTLPLALQAAAVLGLPAEVVTGSGLPVQIVSCGFACLLIPVAARRDVDAAVLDRAAWSAFAASLEAPPACIFFFSVEPGADGATAYSRMFAPALGISEDPATGGASGPLGCYLVEHHVVDANTAAAMVSLQGVKMGRPSRIHISIGIERNAIAVVRVGGQAVFVGEGFLTI